MGDVRSVWVFDPNRRIYRRDAAGRSSGAPIWLEHWRLEEVESETARSWITTRGTKVPKKAADPERFAFSLDDIQRRAYVVENRFRIAEAVGRIKDFEVLKKIAECIGYQEKTLDN